MSRPPPIFNASMQAILTLMEGSTHHLYYPAEMQLASGYSKPVVLRGFNKITEAGLAEKKTEGASLLKRAPRDYYELTPHGLALLRLQEPST